ncbi:hypothetical protein BKA81DRAFT_88363 [Phyllosticta paracitricarpa]|uniref:Secreted protein n=1 Tax=Phyllosticta paracitricarpa TaxID=2016321 RepID=A0ABR1N029_9PEZI
MKWRWKKLKCLLVETACLLASFTVVDAYRATREGEVKKCKPKIHRRLGDCRSITVPKSSRVFSPATFHPPFAQFKANVGSDTKRRKKTPRHEREGEATKSREMRWRRAR